jgi:sec-independent protein translocase protein TatA
LYYWLKNLILKIYKNQFKRYNLIFLTQFYKYHKNIIITFVFNIKNIKMILGVVGPWQIVLILAIVVLLFGGKKIPELMKGLGKGIKEFKDASKGEESPNQESK